MRSRQDAIVVWIATLLCLVGASATVWWIGGVGFCGEEAYDTPPGSLGDTLCGALVKPFVPWALIASLPVLTGASVGLVALLRQSRRMFLVSVLAPWLVFVCELAVVIAIV